MRIIVSYESLLQLSNSPLYKNYPLAQMAENNIYISRFGNNL